MEFLRNTVFATKFEVDNREPEIFFHIPQVGNFGVLSFDPLFWHQLTILVLLQTVVNVAVAYIVYRWVVQKQGTITAYLVGYGFICPILFYVPIRLIFALDIRNKALLISSVASSVLLFFRCLEAMYGTAPRFATRSLGQFCLYYAVTVQFDFDEKTEQVKSATRQELIHKFLKFVNLFLMTSLLFSMLIPFDYNIFPRQKIESLTDLFFWGNLANNYVMASLTSSSLDVGSTGVGLAISLLSGINTLDLNSSPLTKSSSPSNFWGQRWNRLVSSALKRGVFKPVRKQGYSRTVAALATFVASGIIHEIILLVLEIHEIAAKQQVPLFGTHLLFFLWNGIVLVLERLLHGNPTIEWMSKNLPAPVRTFFVILTVLPLAHLFTQEYVDLNFYSAFSIGFPRIIWLGNNQLNI